MPGISLHIKRFLQAYHLFDGLAACCLCLWVLAAAACKGPVLPEELAREYERLPEHPDFNLHIKPILSDKCFACHGPDEGKREAGLRLDVPEIAYSELPESPGKRAIVPGNLKESEVFRRILSTDPDEKMPPPSFKVELSEREKALLLKWIEQGAIYQPHWAFIPPQKTPPPTLDLPQRVQNPIDAFVLKQLEAVGLQPSPEADKELLLRRLSFDLTGLPPAPEEVDAFLADSSARAYEQQVDRLLASVHFGERLAADWMDVARFSDTYGYQVDRYRDMSPWRDWVIKAFNHNMPYDQFLAWQLAGDLIPGAGREQILATGFNRLHPQNMEDGIIDEEFRVENVADRVAVLGDGLLGLTLSCARCHDHKFDPISQKEYYQLFSFFNNINETGQISWDKATPVPTLELPTEQQQRTLADLKEREAAQTAQLQTISREEEAAIKAWIEAGAYRQLGHALPQRGLLAHYPLEGQLVNVVNRQQQPSMKREFSPKEFPVFTSGYQGRGLLLDGDAWLDCKEVGIFRRTDAFSIGLWVNLPPELKEGVIFHKNKGTTLHAYRGYQLSLKDGRLEWIMARTWPENAIIEHSLEALPHDEWLHLMVTYDGSSTAAGTRLYLNGKELSTGVVKDNLSRDIVFNYLRDIIYPEPIEPNLKIGARWRGTGIKGAKVDEIRVYGRPLTALEVARIARKQTAEGLQKPPDALTTAQKAQLSEYYLANLSPAYRQALQALKASRTALADSMEQVQEVMVMKEMEIPRKTFVLKRGVYDQYGEAVFPNTPQHIMPMPEGLPKNRLGLAKWMLDPRHPLTARVAVNRYWQMLFGRGLVNTPQDFGNQGSLPSHAALLDWLAVQFVESGWDLKALLKMMVMSATYRQSSMAGTELLEKDKENVWLARGPAMRLSSEMIRDNALAASGLLNRQVGGKSVYPYQPEGLWAMNFDPYPQDTGEKLYRRSLYTMWRRTNPNPTLATFDQPDRNTCTVKRQQTQTPLQALVLLNDPTFVEAARVMGEKMLRMADSRQAVIWAYRQLSSKLPTETEIAAMLKWQNEEYEALRQHPAKLKGWLEAGEYRVDPALDAALLVSYAVVASTILNSDVTLTKR